MIKTEPSIIPAESGVSRRTMLKRSAVLALGAALELAPFSGLLIPSHARGEDRPPAAAGPIVPGCDADGLEQLTRQRLIRMEKEVAGILAGREVFSGPQLHQWAIRLLMWGPAAGWSRQILWFLGDHPDILEGIPLLAPQVRWLSASYIFPLETGGMVKTRAAELDRVFAFIGREQLRGRATTLDNVGDASLSAADAEAYERYYLLLIDTFSGRALGNQLFLSLKLSALVYDLEAALGGSESAQAKRREIKERLARLLTAAAGVSGNKRVFIRLDMEEYAYKDLTLQLFRETVSENRAAAVDDKGLSRLGVVLQAYLRDTAADLRELVRWGHSSGVRVPVRLVKGAYLTHERRLALNRGRKSPVWNFKSSTDANFEALAACMLLVPDAVEPAFATHNIRSICRVTALAEVLNVEKGGYEFQMLYGMGDPIKEVVVAHKQGFREYVPAGSLARGLKYAGRRFLELANADNALARTMRGDFTVVNQGAPVFRGEEDIADSKKIWGRILRQDM